MFSILFSLTTIILLIIDFFKYQNTENRINKIAAILTAIITFLTVLNINVPKPEIYRINEGTGEDINGIKIEIDCKQFPIYETYYSLDGTNPKYGYRYEAPFMIYDDSTVIASTKFLWWWSDTDKSSYGFEKINFDNELESSDDIDIQENIESQEICKSEIPIESEEELPGISQDNSEEDSNYQEYKTESVVYETVNPPQVTKPTNEGLNLAEGYDLLKYLNQERQKVDIEGLVWNSELALTAQNIVTQYVEYGDILILDDSLYVIGRQCNGAKNAETAISHWITGNDWIPSEAENLLNLNYTQMGGALYYLPNGNEYGYHYFWVICLQ